MSVEIRSLVIRADFSSQGDSDNEEEEKYFEALAIAEHKIRQEMADMIAEAFRRREEH